MSGCIGVSGLYGGLAVTLGTQGPEGYRGIRGLLRGIGCRESGGV